MNKEKKEIREVFFWGWIENSKDKLLGFNKLKNIFSGLKNFLKLIEFIFNQI